MRVQGFEHIELPEKLLNYSYEVIKATSINTLRECRRAGRFQANLLLRTTRIRFNGLEGLTVLQLYKYTNTQKMRWVL